MVPCWMPGSTSASVIATGEASIRRISSSWNGEASTRSFMPLRSASLLDLLLGDMIDDGPIGAKPMPSRPLASPEAEHRLLHRRIESTFTI